MRKRNTRSAVHVLAVLAVLIAACAPAPTPTSTRLPPPALAPESPVVGGNDFSFTLGRTPRTAAQAEDFFYTFGQRTPVRVSLDQVGVLAVEGANADQVQSFAARFGLTLVSQPDERIFIFGLSKPRPRPDLVKLARDLVAQGKGVVAQAGMVTRPPGTETPMLVSDRFIVQFQPGASAADIAAFNAQNRVNVVIPNPFVSNHFLLTVTAASTLDALQMSNLYQQNTKLVDFAHPNFVKVLLERETNPNDPLYGNQWHHRNTGQSAGTVDADVDTSMAWDIDQGSLNTIIAVIDSGFDMNHPDLMPNFWVNPGETAGNGNDEGDPNPYIDDVNGWDFTACDVANPPADCGDNNPTGGNHGTAVAGVAAAAGNNGRGVTGSCPNCGLMLIRIPRDDFSEGLAFDYARTMGAHIITNSWGFGIGTPPCTTNLCTAINNAAAMGRGGLGSVVLFAMNNPNVEDCSGNNPDISSLASVIAVSRSTNQDRFDFSGFGNCMDLLAPTGATAMDANGNPLNLGTLWITTTDRTGTAGYNNTSVAPTCPSVEPAPPPNDARDYTFCFNGTSSATPLVAGVAGLVLDAAPGLTQIQVQQLLQDTTDHIEDSSGVYANINGYSSPATGIATHGFGRVNAFEALRVVAPAAQGGKDGVDIFLRDNRLDWGNTEQSSNTLFEANRGYIGHWESMDIKVDAPPYQPAPTAATFDGFIDETPSAIPGEINRAYVRVRNRGPVTAGSVTVKLHWTQFGTALAPLPADFWTAFPANSTDTSQWHPLNCAGTASPTCTITDLAYSGSTLAGSAADASQIVQFDFPAPAVDPALANHFCLMAAIESTQDPISAGSKASFVVDNITPTDNNVTHRNYSNLNTRGDRSFKDTFIVRNPLKASIQSVLRLRAPDGWNVTLDRYGFNRAFTLFPGQEVRVTATITLPQNDLQGEIHIIQERLNPVQVMGGLVYNLQPQLSIFPDLTATLSGPASATAGEYLSGSIALGVANQGASPAPGTETGNGRPNQNGYKVDLVLSTDSGVPQGFALFSETFREDALLKDGRAGSTPSLNPGQSTALPIGVKIPIHTPPGNYFMCAQVDPVALVKEGNETNNVTCYPIRIDPGIP